MPRHGRSFPFRARFRSRTFKGILGVAGTAAILFDATGAGASIAAAVGTAAITLGASGTGAVAATTVSGAGTAAIAVGATGAGASSAAAAGTAAILFTATGTGAATTSGVGTAALVFGASGTGARAVAAAGSAALVFSAPATGAATAARAGTASVTVAVTGVGASSGGATGLIRIQGTPRTRALGTLSVAITFATPPTVGNAIVVPVIVYDSVGPISAATLTCADNRGNSYTLAGVESLGFVGSAIFVCAKVVTATAPFTITITQATNSYFEASAIEVGNVGSGLVIDRTVTGFASTAAPTTGTTAALTHDAVFLVSVMAVSANQAAITVESVAPSWLQEWENLDHSTSVAGEADSRVRSGVLGTTQSCSWTVTTAQATAAVLAVFAALAPPTSAAGTAAIAIAATGVGQSSAPSSIRRIQATPPFTSSASTPAASVTFAAPPAVGNSIIVAVISLAAAAPTSVTDTFGNTYTLVVSQGQPSIPNTVSCHLCRSVAATGAPFTVTVTGVSAFRVVTAIETTAALPDQVASVAGSFPTTATTGVTPALAGPDDFVVALLGTTSNLITVDATTPTWREEAEEVTSSAIRGEVDSRTITGAAGTTQTATWALNGAHLWVGLMATFVAVPAATPSGGAAAITFGATASGLALWPGAGTAAIAFGATGSSLLPAVPVRATQLVAELVFPVPGSPVVATQVAAELLLALGPQPDEARVTQLVCELIVLPRAVPPCTAGGLPVDDVGLGSSCRIPLDSPSRKGSP